MSSGCSPYAGEKTYEEGSQRLEGIAFSEKRAGVLQWELLSQQGTLLEEQGQARLVKPRLAMYQKGKLTSRAEAENGLISTRTHEIELSTRVVVRSTADDSILRTESLLYSPARGKIYTEHPVEVDRADGHMSGQGLEATPDLKEIRIKKQRTVIIK